MHTAIAESMVAVATLSASLRDTSSASWTAQPALFHYTNAIGTLVRCGSAKHVALLVCMFLWLYEQFDNQHARALFHRESANSLLVEWQSHELGADRVWMAI